jgi:hypothetical protein
MRVVILTCSHPPTSIRKASERPQSLALTQGSYRVFEITPALVLVRAASPIIVEEFEVRGLSKYQETADSCQSWALGVLV